MKETSQISCHNIIDLTWRRNSMLVLYNNNNNANAAQFSNNSPWRPLDLSLGGFADEKLTVGSILVAPFLTNL